MSVSRIGVVGLGNRCARILAAMKEIGWSFEIAGYVDAAPTGLPVIQAQGIQAHTSHPNVAALLAAGPLDLIIVASPNHLHLEHLQAVLGANTPVLCEKPVVRTEAETRALARLLRARGAHAAPIFVGLVLRSAPLIKAVIERVDSGALGRIVSIDATEHLSPEHGAYIARNWRRRAAWGGSYLLDKTCHDFDVFNRIVKARAANVASMGGRSVFRPERAAAALNYYEDGKPAYRLTDPGWQGTDTPFQADMDLADHQTALVRYANGVLLSFHSNSHAAIPERRWNIIGSEGQLIADLVANRLTFKLALARDDAEVIAFGGLSAESHNGADHAMARDLLAALKGERAFPVTVNEGLEAGLTVMAVDQAMADGALIDCRPMWDGFDAARAREAA